MYIYIYIYTYIYICAYNAAISRYTHMITRARFRLKANAATDKGNGRNKT